MVRQLLTPVNPTHLHFPMPRGPSTSSGSLAKTLRGELGDSVSHPILACRRRSRSIWLHFPHLELLFLFWAFEGAATAQVSALTNAACPRVFWLALAALVRKKYECIVSSAIDVGRRFCVSIFPPSRRCPFPAAIRVRGCLPGRLHSNSDMAIRDVP